MSARNYYETYWTPQGYNPRGGLHHRIATLLLPLATGSTDVLDVGCGDGRSYQRWLSDRCQSYLGVDISQTAIDKASELGLNAMRIDDASELPKEDESVDLIVCIEVLEHLFDPAATVAEFYRVLRPGGAVLATVPNVAYWRRRIDLFFFGRWNPFGDNLSVAQPWRDPHIRFFTKDALERLFRSRAFDPSTIGAHGGGMIQEIPVVRRIAPAHESALYGQLTGVVPSLFGARLHILATKSARQ